MSDVYIPGVKSRFNSEKLIEDLMNLERVPKDRTERNIENLENRKGYWREVGRRISSLRESARLLYSFQNPFNERMALSSDDSAISASASREAVEQTYQFTVIQTAQADRFLSSPLDEKFTVEGGTYSFSVGNDEISFNFRGGTLKDFVDALNRRGRDKLGASLIAVQPGTKSLLLESKLAGAENRLGFSGTAEELAVSVGMLEQGHNVQRDIAISEDTVRKNEPVSGNAQAVRPVMVKDGILTVPALSSASTAFDLDIPPNSALYLKLEIAAETEVDRSEIFQIPPGPGVSAGSVSRNGTTVENDPSFVPLPEWTPPLIPEKIDNLSVLSLTFANGSGAVLPPITDSANFTVRQFRLADVAAGKTIVALNITNTNTHRDISIRNMEVFDPGAFDGGLQPANPVSTAQDAIITLEGVEMRRPTNTITDIIPGVTVTARGVSDRPVQLEILPDRETVKEALITLVGNYNRLMAEINVLTRADNRIIDELSYLSAEESAEMRKRLGAFSGDTTLIQFKSGLQQTVSAPYPTGEDWDLTMLGQIGITTNTRSSAGYDPSRLRGYLEIDEKVLDAALETKLPAIRQLFGSDTNGDLVADTGVAVNLDALSKPFIDTGGIVTLKTGTIDSRISQDRGRIETMDRQLAVKEAELKLQYSRMEGAYARMEQMSASLENFNQQNGNNR
jgi:flagellar hook-associated protein 2